MSKTYYRPIVSTGKSRPSNARPIAGGNTWFHQAEVLTKSRCGEFISIDQMPADVVEAISKLRAPIAALNFDQPIVMGILNVTPDSFSDGGQFETIAAAQKHALEMIAQGAELIDIGGESTRPGAQTVAIKEEIARVVPAIRAVREHSKVPISIDTRKADVADAAIKAGANIVNDVSGFTYDPHLAAVVAESGAGVCLMHTQGPPETMQDNPEYSDILLEVYDFLDSQIRVAEQSGISRDRIMVDPGIGFGKTVEHCLELIAGISLFHGLGCPILLGVSRKSFIGHITGQESAQDRSFGSVSAAIVALSQGVQLFRVHDIEAHAEAFKISTAIQG